MRIVQVSEDKIGTLTEYAEKMLKYGGKLMSCIEELENEGNGYGERSSMGYREPEWDDTDMGSRYGNRRRRDRFGRYM